MADTDVTTPAEEVPAPPPAEAPVPAPEPPAPAAPEGAAQGGPGCHAGRTFRQHVPFVGRAGTRPTLICRTPAGRRLWSVPRAERDLLQLRRQFAAVARPQRVDRVRHPLVGGRRLQVPGDLD